MKKIFLLSVLCFCVSLYSISPVYSQNTGESSSIQVDIPYECEEDLIEIMFDKDSQVRLRSGSLVDFKSDALTGVNQILEQLDWHTWYRICDVPEDILDQWSINGERNTGKPIYNMNNIYRLQIPKGYNIWELCKSLQNLPGIILAGPVPKPMALPIPGNFQSFQGYLNPASSSPTGIDALYAWTQSGGTGTGVTVCDLEYSWNYNHADISKAAGSQINTLVQDPFNDTNHGTAVIGELVADNNGWGTTGICYGSGLKTCGTYYGSPVAWNPAGAIGVAIANLNAGDIILLEQQWAYTYGGNDYIPVEWFMNYSPNPQTNNSVYAAIVNAVANGIHVVEAGGNGNVNTGGLTWFGNSGAIIVGAGGASISNDLQRLSFSSYGTRFDLQGWGENVFTTGYGTYYSAEGVNYYYTSTFNGTSSASPIVAGALACAGGYYLLNVSPTPPTPAYMRTHLKTYGTAQVTPPIGNIGPRPNLYAAINNFPPPVQNYDWGDAPDPTFPTLAASTPPGAYHIIVAGIQLGNTIDPDPDGQPTVNADGDDNDGNNDDDGVVFNSVLSPGSTVNVTVTASVPGILNAWLDFDGNGSWDASEQIISNVVPAGPTVHNFTVPASSIIGPTYARFRFCTQGATTYFGQAPDGEVEDYQVDIVTEGSSIKWEQLPDTTTFGMDVTASNNPMFGQPVVLADDFECTTQGLITDIHVWGSWWQDIQPDMNSVIFHLSIHADIPAGVQEPWSIPGDILWEKIFMFGEYDSELYNVGQEGWFDPLEMIYEPLGDTECWLYNFYIDAGEAFMQEGTPDNPMVYWLEVQAEFLDPLAMFGWKTSETHWNDDAVWGNGIAPFMGPWNELIYPPGHEYQGQSIDLAFAITTEEGPTDEYDFGDAPEGDGAIAYPSTGMFGYFPTCITVLPSGYVSHGPGPFSAYFGPSVDLELDGNAGFCPGCFPTYDDDECFQDGDAGLIMPEPFTINTTNTVVPCTGFVGTPLGTICQTANWGVDIDIDVQNPSTLDLFVNVLFDWNQNGYWLDDPGITCFGSMTPEHVLINFIVPAGYSGPLSNVVPPPPSFVIGPNAGYFWSRFTISDLPVPAGEWNGEGEFAEGETEDYLILVEEEPTDEYDFGDAPEGDGATAYPSLGVDGMFPTCITVGPVGSYIQHGFGENWAWFGPMVDIETDGNAGACPSCFPLYDVDECFNDLDAGLLTPDSYTIDATGAVIPCTGATGSPLGIICQNATWGVDIDIDVTNTMPVDGFVNVLIDWNQDGQWQNDATTQCAGIMTPEHVLVNFGVPAGHIGPLSGLMPIGSSFQIGPNNGYVWVRFSITEAPVTTDWDGSGVFEDGETEDYLLLILEPQDEIDFGDAPDPSYPTLLASTGANHIIDGVTFLGASVDPEPDGQPDPQALGDDNDGNDDEDGVTFDWPLAVGNPCKITVNASVANGLFSGWVDFDGNGSWADPGEQIFIDIPLVAGDNSLNFMIPTTTTAGLITYARFRFSTQPGLSYDGSAIDGEVEDYEVEIIEIGDYKWAQYPDTTLPGLHAHDYINAGGGHESIVLADDWLCNGGLVTDIHWWGNYELDALQQEIRGSGINYFHVSIHADDPTGSCLPVDPEILGFNIPFSALVEQNTGLTNIEGCSVYLYEFILPQPFDQEIGTRYWIDISAFSNDPNSPVHWRWQESMRSYYPILCGAAEKIDPAVLPWTTIRWGSTPPRKYSDMAFIITSEEFEPMDFGDADDPTYPTYLANDGARHSLDGVTFMGTSVDSEFNGQPDPNALGDDNDGNDDEDGVTFTSLLVQGQNAIADIVVSVDGILNAWLDFNANGSWGDPGEQIATDVSVSAGTYTLTFNVPLTAIVGTTYSRFRFSTASGLSYTGLAVNGEVEDHEVTIEVVPNKWAQYPDTLLPGLHAHDYDSPPYGQIILADDWICDGGWVTDFHWWGNYELDALSQEIRGAGIGHFHLSIHTLDPTGCLPQDPEIWGVDVPFSSLTEHNTGLVNLEGCSIYLYEYILEEPFPQIQGEHYWLDITAFCADPVNPAHWRWQESSRKLTPVLCGAVDKTLPNPGTWQTIAWANLTFSDMAFVITSGPAPELDMGDADDPTFPTLLINSGAAHIIDGITFLGTSVDSETDGQPDPNALGDDNDGNDDEDGVTVNPIFQVTPGGTIWYDIVASVSGTLNIWIDWNANGSWGDTGEHAGIDISLSVGTNSVLISVPANAVVGDTYSRFRFSTVGGLSFTGIAPDGEVEDHELTIEGDLDFGDAPDQAFPAFPTLAINNGARHLIDPTIFLGYSIDLEPDGQPDITATGDDNDGNDDEDGVLIPAVLSHGSMNSITVIASANGYLNGWIDFNSSGNWTEADEHVLMDQSVTVGPNIFNISIPSTSVKGTTYARFRFSTVPGLSYVGQAPDGEVEDYQVEIGEPEKWLQNPDLTDFGLDIDATFNLESPDPPMILADDFLCTTTGSITRIEIWGSWLYDYIPFFDDPGAVIFTLSIHEDIPADQSPTGFSMPGDVIWWKVYDPIEFMFEPFAFGLQEGWYNPATGYYEPLGDTQCWKYIFELDEGEFVQEGTADEPKVYWLDVQAQPLDPDPFCRFGWKTSVDHWNDDAVWTIGTEPYLGDWNELRYPDGHPLFPESIDLAFAIYGLENPYILVDLTAFLEGPFTGSDMQPTLNGANLIPLNQPYSSDPTAKWYYTGTESVGSIPAADVVDWVMIELRDATSASNATGLTMIDEKAAFIKKDGKIVATDGSNLMKFYVSFSNNPYAIVWHRNHLGILSANPLNMVGLGLYRYDFTTGLGQAYLNGQKNLGGTIYGMMGGDGQPDGSVDNNDLINVWAPEAGNTGYKMGDYNMDTQVENKDKDDVWYLNTGLGTQVPN